MKPVKATLFAFVLSLAVVSCMKDKHERPSFSLKTSDGYTAADATVDTSTLVRFGIVADRAKAPLSTFNVSASFDGDPTLYNVETDALSSEQANHYERDFIIKTRSTVGTGKWIFTITDQNGNRAQKTITLTVVE